MDFPFSLNDLGDDYDFANYVDMGDGTFGIDCDSSVDEAINSLNELCKNYDDNGLFINIKYSDNDYCAYIFISEGEKNNRYIF